MKPCAAANTAFVGGDSSGGKQSHAQLPALQRACLQLSDAKLQCSSTTGNSRRTRCLCSLTFIASKPPQQTTPQHSHLHAALACPPLAVRLALHKHRLLLALGPCLPWAVVAHPHQPCVVLAGQACMVHIKPGAVKVDCRKENDEAGNGGLQGGYAGQVQEDSMNKLRLG